MGGVNTQESKYNLTQKRGRKHDVKTSETKVEAVVDYEGIIAMSIRNNKQVSF